MDGAVSNPNATLTVGYEYSELIQLVCIFDDILQFLAVTPVGKKVSSPTLRCIRGTDLSIAITKDEEHQIYPSLMRASRDETWHVQAKCSYQVMPSWKQVADGKRMTWNGDSLIYDGLKATEDRLRVSLNPDGSLTVCVAMHLRAGPYGVTAKSIARNVTSTLVADWAGLLESGVGSDVTLQLKDGERTVHKLVLMARSPVFRRMFETDMAERRDGKIYMADVSTSVADHFVKFLYTDLFPDEPAKQVQECLLLLHVANKYQVEGLQDRCCGNLIENLKINNAVVILQAADTCNIPTLRCAALSFITSSTERLAEVQDTEGFDDLGRDLLKELLERVAPASRKRKSKAADTWEFADDTIWATLTQQQLRRLPRARACEHRY